MTRQEQDLPQAPLEREVVRVCVLGPVELRDGNERVRSLTRPAARLLAMLAVMPGRPLSTDRLPEATADEDAMSALRNVLGDRLVAADDGHRLVLGEGDELDSVSFEQLVDSARTMRPQERQEVLRRALALWRGRPFDGFGDEPWTQEAARRLHELHALATEDLAESLIELGEAHDAVSLLQSHDATHRERPVGLLMRALAVDGRAADARQVFERFRTRLRDDLGIEPTSELRELEVSIRGGMDAQRDVTIPSSPDLPTGTVTFLFTDVEGSTERWQRDETAMAKALAEHDEVIGDVVRSCDGRVFKHTGDGICAVFSSARQAQAAARQAQFLLELPVRMGLHTGEAELRNGDYYGQAVNRTARVMDAGHGGQVVLSSASAELLSDVELVDLGSHRLKGIEVPVRLFQLGRRQFPALRAPRERVGNLPMQLNNFVGRADEVARLATELAVHRVVTLIGSGGAGKTRLAVEAATAVEPNFPDGCWYVELAAVPVGEAVEFGFAAGLELRVASEGDVISGVVAALQDKRLLIVVDNCEHVLHEAGEAIATIARACPAVAILATSREPLMVAGERLLPVSPLPLDDAQRLFIERASAEAPDLVIDARQSAAISELCARLDRLPLAIELAASRARALSPVELAADLDERFRLLVGGRRSALQRHQTMEGTLDWSYELCEPTEQTIFDRLTVFPGAFDLHAARAVASDDPVSQLDIVDVVPRLVDRSLVQRTTRTDGTSQYHLLETTRAYGRQHLRRDGTLDALRRRHAAHVTRTMNALWLDTIGPDETAARQRIAQLLPDCLAACRWFVDHQDWNGALEVSTFGISDSLREEENLWQQIEEAILASGVDRTLLADEVALGIGIRDLPVDELCRRAWESIEAGWRPPTHRFSHVPQAVVEGDDTTGMRSDDLLASLSSLRAAPVAVRCTAEHAVMRNLAVARPELAARHLSSFQTLIRDSGSRTGLAWAAEVRGLLAWSARDWAAAARWFTEALDADPSAPKQWFQVTVSWHRLVALALSGGEISVGDLCAPWRWLREANCNSLRWWSASASAVVLERRLGQPDLAQRFRQWVVQDDLGGIAEIMEMRLAGAAFRLDRGPFDEHVDLDDLVDRLMALA